MDGKFLPDHVREEWFELYVMGTLPEEQMAILEARLLVDEDCRLKLDQTEAYVQAMRVALRRAQAELGEPARSRWHWRALLARPWPVVVWPAVAAMALVFTVALLYRPVDTLGPVSETVPLNAQRGGAGNAGAAAHPGHLHLRLDLRGIPDRPTHTLQVVTEGGQEVWSGPFPITGDFTTVDVRQKLEPGHYLVRICSGEEQLREFYLSVQ
jgi:hypothetical protein